LDVDGDTMYVVEGDLLLDEDELESYAQRLVALEQLRNVRLGEEGGVGIMPRPSAALVGITEGGKVVRWAPGTVLTYTVLKDTFENDDQYESVVGHMRVATSNWQDTCGVEFQYDASLDDSTTTRPEGVLFPVRGFDSNGRFIASAFFPNGPRHRRRVLIDPSFFETSFDHTGVLRHELGHVLGFRHEHIRSGAPAVCPDETTADTFDLTPYDPQSVMHYFCGGVGTKDLAISDVDKQGARKVYGLPRGMLRFIEP
jgi:hypothetical protein